MGDLWTLLRGVVRFAAAYIRVRRASTRFRPLPVTFFYCPSFTLHACTCTLVHDVTTAHVHAVYSHTALPRVFLLSKTRDPSILFPSENVLYDVARNSLTTSTYISSTRNSILNVLLNFLTLIRVFRLFF